ncbi:flagellar biosynthesis/type III secretory pathway protein FliH [Paucimonas lemoignei]|uniref:Flagellar assembly protein FliH n=1 Tax=Paucimonas lemoignei TaxID=29443 RepID=A0A4R3HYG9_PAULE|nr:FliH/SctL family protein [Paucimonas lemoignei]TCS37723.1 flagellar biosynthesis/type III secretory pathway protein FliH [Paucimonas lemoignei]
MDPIIKTTRVSQNAFSLDVRQPKTGMQSGQGQGKPKQDAKFELGKPAAATKATDISVTKVASEPILNDATLEKLVPKPISQEPHPELGRTKAHDLEKEKEREKEKEKNLLQEAYEKAKLEGYQAGLETAKVSSQKELNQALGQLKELFQSLKNLDEALFQEMEDSAAEVVFEAVTKIIGQAAIDKKIAYAVTRQAIEQVKGRERLIVRVSSKDYELVKETLTDPDTDGLFIKSVSVVADNLVQLGGCLIETEAGNLDARLEIQLQRLKETLLGVRKTNDDA